MQASLDVADYASLAAAGDASSGPRGDEPSLRAHADGSGDGSRCSWCAELLPATARADSVFCSRKCRQSAFRLRRRRTTDARADHPLRFGYADPPYPGRARRYYANEPTFAGEVDHAKLIASLEASYDGWALSTAADALRDILPLCPPRARVCPWVKPIGASTRTLGLHNTWEPLIVVSGRRLRGGIRDWLSAQPARRGGALPGRKPLKFCAWLFDALGMLAGDELDDLFPGTGVVSRAWRELSLRSSTTRAVVHAGADDASPATSSDGDRAQPSPGAGSGRRLRSKGVSAGVSIKVAKCDTRSGDVRTDPF